MCFNGRRFFAVVVGLLCSYIRGSFSSILRLSLDCSMAHEKNKPLSERCWTRNLCLPNGDATCACCGSRIRLRAAIVGRQHKKEERACEQPSPPALVSVMQWHCRSSSFRVLFKHIYSREVKCDTFR